MFTFNVNDKPLYIYIKEEVLKGGCIYKPKNHNYCRYIISKKDILIKLINLINGKFRTPKIRYLHRAIDYMNIVHNVNMKKLPLDNSSLESNAWLAGMTDSDGNFHISLQGIYGLNNSIAKGRVICTFSIKQRVLDMVTGDNCVPFMTEIANFFQSNINYTSNNAMTFLVQANSKHYLTKSYFDKYPLMSSKYLNYLCYLQGQNYLGKRLADEEIITIRSIKNSMNNKRIYFN
jgi:hypothetical protein